MTNKPPCVVCKTPAATRCSCCRIAHYCSPRCQRKDWPSHKIACTPAASQPSASGTVSNTIHDSHSVDPKVTSVPTGPSRPLESSGSAGPSGSTESSGSPGSLRNHKAPPQELSTTLKFVYQPAPDGVDENLVIFFHGLGDKIKPNFVKLAQSLQLPQTATCCIQAPTPVPYLEEEGWQWFPSFNVLTGELLGPDSPERMLQVQQTVRPQLVKFIQHCIDHSGYSPSKITLFGFSQGGEIALDLAAFGGFNLRAVISIAGYLMEESQNAVPATKLSTKVLIMQGDRDDLRSIKAAKDRFKYVQRVFGKANVDQKIIEGMGHGMPSSESGWRPLMEFFALNLDNRSVTLESMADVVELKA
ncbi:hypothetical protein BX616_003555 [Lobosporangium transversale]|uniref:Alpha/Beta hydrolase protein n=1 Tax=Lobosporangium transversale TaxID=64571 RepID=A0A1Y2GRP2_9FUNG|nr:Alpha/Beta hydrolase protein [Lobosporangium transversale]KAF9916515.1 hypothetical protein BX616_003555 [Lobosporangium transversale]ORZ20818.1 Alpha/Beta hydrolase protein [Lobosporangium transversale]|eukprot:XP_021882727.1 Alpha/Beta hydrolase protein [Lobosporangium transversale]